MWIKIGSVDNIEGRNIIINIDKLLYVYLGNTPITKNILYVNTMNGDVTEIGRYETRERAKEVYEMLVNEITINVEKPGYVFEVPTE